MLEFVNQYGNLLSPLSVLLQFFLWGSGGAAVCWRYTRRSISQKVTEIEKLQHDVNFWQRKYQETESNLLKVLNSDEASTGKSIASLLKFSGEIDQEEHSRVLEDWISLHSGLIGQVYATAASAKVAANGAEPKALEKAIAHAKSAHLLDPENPNHVELQRALATYASLLSSFDPADYETDRGEQVLSREALYALNDAHSSSFDDADYQLAALLAKRLLDEMVRRTDTEDFETAIWQNNLAVALSMCGQTELSLKYFEEAHEVSETRADDEGRTVHRISYGRALCDVDRYQEALELLDAAYDDAVRIFGADHANVESCRASLKYARQGLSEATVEPAS